MDSSRLRVVGVYYLWLALNLLGTGVVLIRTGWDWGYGDWLINYQAGFVRRGLAGQVTYFLHKVFHCTPLVFPAIFTLFCYGVTFWALWRLIPRLSGRWWEMALLLSPVTFAFPVISRTAFRKEILVIAFLAALVASLRKSEALQTNDALLSLVLSIAFVGIVLSHEGMVAYLPYLAVAVRIGLGSMRRALVVVIVPTLLAAVALWFTLRHPGDAATAQGICSSLGAPTWDSCSGQIKFLAWTKAYASERVAAYIASSHYYLGYTVCFLLGVVPIVTGVVDMRRRGKREEVRWIAVAAVVAGSISVPLFVYGFDWGRWLYIHFACLTLLLLFVDSDTRMAADETVVASANTLAMPRGLAWICLALYATCWSMPGFGSTPRFGYISNAVRMLHAVAHGRRDKDV